MTGLKDSQNRLYLTLPNKRCIDLVLLMVDRNIRAVSLLSDIIVQDQELLTTEWTYWTNFKSTLNIFFRGICPVLSISGSGVVTNIRTYFIENPSYFDIFHTTLLYPKTKNSTYFPQTNVTIEHGLKLLQEMEKVSALSAFQGWR